MPNNWKTYKLGEIADVQNGYAFKAAELVGNGTPVIKIKNIISPNVSIEDVSYFNGNITSQLEKYIAKQGDFLISMTGSTVNVMSSAVGKMGRYRINDVSLINQRVGKIYVTKPEIVSFEYLCQYLNRYEIHYSLALNATGSANQANISPAQIKDIDILLPSLTEQQSIASILSAIDDKIENNLAINKTLEEMSMAFYKHWFVDFGPFQNGEFVESELGMIPKGWEVRNLGDLYDTTSGGTPSRAKMEYYEDGTIQWIKSKELDNTFIINTEEKITEIALSKSSAKRFPAKSVLIAMYGATVGEIAINSEIATCNQAICAIKQTDLPYYYAFLFLKNEKENILNQAVGSAQQNISQIIIKNLKLINPNASDVKDLFNEFDGIFNKLESNIKENQTLTQVRDTLLPQLISGEVRLKEFRE